MPRRFRRSVRRRSSSDRRYRRVRTLLASVPRPATIISETSEKQRNIFFGIMLNKIRLELARDHDHPAGSPVVGYEFAAPLDKDGKIAGIWDNVRLKGHVQGVLDAVKESTSGLHAKLSVTDRQRLEQFLTSQGRRKFLSPLYTEMAKTPAGADRALRIYEKARPGYHSVSRNTIDEILGWRG